MQKSSLLFLLIYCTNLCAGNAVTYLFSTGRFGDNVLAYCHAKWISYCYKIPLLYQPFKYSDELALHYQETHYDNWPHSFETMVQLEQPLTIDAQANTLYLVPFFPESSLEICLPPFCSYYFAVNWNDPEFKKEIQAMIRPVSKNYVPLELPHGYISVALHVRRGTHYDSILGIDVKDLSDYHKGPLLFKIPPDSYYIDQLKLIAHMYSNQPLYVYLFTDDPHPEHLIQTYKNSLSEYDIVFDCSENKNDHDSNVLEDFFKLVFTPFNCLVRPDSHYSFIASKLGSYDLVISPKHHILNGLIALIDEVEIEYNFK